MKKLFWMCIFPFIVAASVGALVLLTHRPGTLGDYMALPAGIASFALTVACVGLVRHESI